MTVAAFNLRKEKPPEFLVRESLLVSGVRSPPGQVPDSHQVKRGLSIVKRSRSLRISVREISLLKRLELREIFVELKRSDAPGIIEPAVLAVVGSQHPFPSENAHHEHGRIEMERP